MSNKYLVPVFSPERELFVAAVYVSEEVFYELLEDLYDQCVKYRVDEVVKEHHKYYNLVLQ